MFSSDAPSYRRGTQYIALAATAWGTGGVAAALLHSTGGLGPLAVSFWRFLGGALVLAAVRCRAREPWPRPGRRALVTGVGMATYQTAYFAAINATGVAVATLVAIGMSPVCTALGGRLWLGEKLGRRGLATLALAVAGLGLLVLGGSPAHPVSAAGLGFGVLSALGYAGMTLYNRATALTDAGPVDNALLGLAVGAGCLLLPALGTGWWPHGAVSPVLSPVLLAYLGVVPSALAFVLFFRGLRVVPASSASVLTLVEPVVAAVLGATLLGERLTAAMVAGGLLLLGTTVHLARQPSTVDSPQ